MFKGSMVAIVTPFSNGRFDEKTYSGLIEWHIESGTSAIIPCGTTGESATLEYDEHYRVIETAIKTVNGRVPVIAGTGANSTEETIKMTKEAKRLGADASLLVCPYYNKPTQEGVYRHYKAVAEAVDIPIVLYNVPGRTALNILPSTVARLAAIESIVAIKEATGDMKQTSEIIRLCGDAITVLSGDDFTTFPQMMLGGKGAISVTANVMPKESARMCALIEQGNIDEAKRLHYYLDPLNAAMFIETNPIPVKTALALMGKVKEEFRLPLCEMSVSNKDKLKDVLRSYKLI
ncbi:4-hydroxy-tetrahydrodipicolinate synthase [Candidatus Magnetominusculus dajiuhuensis]|uniref:4-hydroxy-tetrahydrodipicolinate synthase n=1 Tax=Candidatus Magnetominusculus dajiuhuensis TaxID=3137712 RepID=UPI003B427E61